MQQLTKFQTDAMSKLLNIGMGNAAHALNELTNEKIELSAPNIALCNKQDTLNRIKIPANTSITVINESFSGLISGNASIVLSESQSLNFVRTLHHDDYFTLDYLTEVEYEAIAEIGNIILNACVGSIANHLQQTICLSIPTCTTGKRSNLAASIPGTKGEEILYFHTLFTLKESNIKGYLMLLMDQASVSTLKSELNRYFRNIN